MPSKDSVLYPIASALTQPAATAMSRRLEEFLKAEFSLQIQHTRSLDAVAHMMGYSNRQVMKENFAPTPDGKEDRKADRKTDRKNTKHGKLDKLVTASAVDTAGGASTSETTTTSHEAAGSLPSALDRLNGTNRDIANLILELAAKGVSPQQMPVEILDSSDALVALGRMIQPEDLVRLTAELLLSQQAAKPARPAQSSTAEVWDTAFSNPTRESFKPIEHLRHLLHLARLARDILASDIMASDQYTGDAKFKASCNALKKDLGFALDVARQHELGYDPNLLRDVIGDILDATAESGFQSDEDREIINKAALAASSRDVLLMENSLKALCDMMWNDPMLSAQEQEAMEWGRSVLRNNPKTVVAVLGGILDIVSSNDPHAHPQYRAHLDALKYIISEGSHMFVSGARRAMNEANSGPMNQNKGNEETTPRTDDRAEPLPLPPLPAEFVAQAWINDYAVRIDDNCATLDVGRILLECRPDIIKHITINVMMGGGDLDELAYGTEALENHDGPFEVYVDEADYVGFWEQLGVYNIEDIECPSPDVHAAIRAKYGIKNQQ